jgi:Glycosyl transferase family 2
MTVAQRSSRTAATSTPDAVEVSIVMPCLNEAETLAVCIQKAQRAIEQDGLAAEIIVADNGSTDGSQVIPAVVLLALGTQTVFASFFISILSIDVN